MEESRFLIPDTKSFKIKRFLRKKPNKISIVIFGLFGIAIILGLYILITYTGGSAVITDNILGITSSQHSNEEIIRKVSKLATLPENETPKVTIIGDLTKVQDQNFFKNAQNGDIVLIYEREKKVIIYRLSEDKIVNIGPLVKPTPTPIDKVIEIRIPDEEVQVSKTPTPSLIEESEATVSPTLSP